MSWYLASLVFQIHISSHHTKQQFETQWRLVEAETEKGAYEKLQLLGLQEQDSFINDKNQIVQWEFIGTPNIQKLDNLYDGIKLLSNINAPEEGIQYRTFIIERSKANEIKYDGFA